MSEVKKGNENVKCRKKLLNGTKCLSEVFVYPCAACRSQSIITKDKGTSGGMNVLSQKDGVVYILDCLRQ